MKTLTLFFLSFYSISFSQTKFELQEVTGTVKSIQPGWGFALEVIELQVGNTARQFKIDPIYGKSILSKIKIGEEVSLKASVNGAAKENIEKMHMESSYWGYRFMDQIIEIKINNEWILTPASPQNANTIWRESNSAIFLEQKVDGDFFIGGLRKGLIFTDGMIAFAPYIESKSNFMKAAAPGKRVSFMGYESPVKDEFLFPIQNVKSIYSFIELTKLEGTIESFISKQNYIRIGMIVGGKRLSFPAENARDLEKFVNNKKVTVYFEGKEDSKSNLLPTIHAIVQDTDTLYFNAMYYGAPDGKHEYKPAQVKGLIEKVNRDDNGHITSLIVAKDFYIEIEHQLATQLGNLLKKGNSVKISGDERIKKQGEVYEKEYRIITPKRITIDQKEFIINQ